MLTGGADILPEHYGEEPILGTYHNPNRDKYEVEYYNIAVKRGIPIIGICRGAQLLCALAGGKLVQHVTGHGQDHMIDTIDGKRFPMSSLHHQMMRPENTEHVLIGWTKGISKCYLVHPGEEYEGRFLRPQGVEAYGHEIGEKVEPEIVYFAKNRGLAIQGHPEMMDPDSEGVAYCNRLVKEYLLK